MLTEKAVSAECLHVDGYTVAGLDGFDCRRLKLWKYEADLYETYLSEVELSDRRMKKLEQVSVQELQEIREAMYKKRRSAYQESMMEALRK